MYQNLISFLRCGGEEKRRKGSGKVPRVDSLGMGRKRFDPLREGEVLMMI